MVLNDNNKAQRNMGVWTGSADQTDAVSYCTVVHNAATYPRDMLVRYNIQPETARRLDH